MTFYALFLRCNKLALTDLIYRAFLYKCQPHVSSGFGNRFKYMFAGEIEWHPAMSQQMKISWCNAFARHELGNRFIAPLHIMVSLNLLYV